MRDGLLIVARRFHAPLYQSELSKLAQGHGSCNSKTIPEYRRMTRFSLKSLLITVLLAALLVDHWIARARRRKEAVDYFVERANEGSFWSHPPVTIRFRGFRRARPFSVWPSHVPEWLSRLVGDRHLDDVRRISLYRGKQEELDRLRMIDELPELVVFDDRESCDDMRWLDVLNELELLSYSRTPEHPPLGDNWLLCLKPHAKLRYLDIGGYEGITDDGLKHLEGLVNLRYLHLSMNDITSRGLRHLDNMLRLEQLALIGTNIDNNAIEIFARHRSLRWLSISCCPYITDEAKIKWLERELPRCAVLRSAAAERAYRQRLLAQGRLKAAIE